MRRLVVAAAVLAGLVGAADAGAQTRVTVNGTEVVIHVPIQLAGLKGRTMRNPLTGARYDDAQLADFMAKESESFWNEGATGADEFFGEKPSGGLSKLRYGDCFTIRIEVEIVATAVFEGGTQVRLEGYHYILFDNNPNGRMVVWDPATPDPTEDTPSAFEQSLEGEWTSWEDYFGGGGHEIGHLLGLGDDYNDQGALPGREGTVMDHGRNFDQNIVDRIVDLVRQSGVELPECWTGTVTEHYRLGVTGSAEAEIRLTVAADRSVTGQGAGEGVIDGFPFTFTLRIRGVRDEDRFRLRIKSSVSRTPAFPLVAPIDGMRARGTYDASGAVVTVALACPAC